MDQYRLLLDSFISDCYSCIRTWGETHILRSTILQKLGVLLEFERYADGYIFQLEFTAVALHFKGRWYEMVRCSTCNVCHMRQICSFFYCLAWFDTVEFNRRPCPNEKKYDDVVFVDRFRYQLTMFGIRILIWFSRHHHAHIAYEMDTAKIIAAFCRISCYLHDLIRWNSIVCHVQTTWCTILWFSLIDSDINWLCFKCVQ